MIGFSIQAFAQDPQFVQFYASPLQLNPAMTGVHPGKWRVVANYREQWSSILDSKPYKSLSASFDAKSTVSTTEEGGRALYSASIAFARGPCRATIAPPCMVVMFLPLSKLKRPASPKLPTERD